MPTSFDACYYNFYSQFHNTFETQFVLCFLPKYFLKFSKHLLLFFRYWLPVFAIIFILLIHNCIHWRLIFVNYNNNHIIVSHGSICVQIFIYYELFFQVDVNIQVNRSLASLAIILSSVTLL